MPTTTQLISAQTLTSNTASVTFNSIPQTFTDLYFIVSAKTTRSDGETSEPIQIKFNSSTSGYTALRFQKNGSSSQSSSSSGETSLSIGTANSNSGGVYTFASQKYYIPNYTSNSNKSVSADSVGETNGTYADQVLTAGKSTLSSGITSITIETTSPNSGWQQYSTVYLYGIKNS